MMESFVKMNNGFQLLTIFQKHSIVDVWQVSEYVSELTCVFIITIIIIAIYLRVLTKVNSKKMT